MALSKLRTMSSMTNFFNAVKDHVLGVEIPVVVDTRHTNLAYKQANIRAVSLREGFQAIRARGDEMNLRIEQYKKQRDKTALSMVAANDSNEADESIVLSSVDNQSSRRVDLSKF